MAVGVKRLYSWKPQQSKIFYLYIYVQLSPAVVLSAVSIHCDVPHIIFVFCLHHTLQQEVWHQCPLLGLVCLWAVAEKQICIKISYFKYI